jgi:hypothetical protein
LAWWACWCRTNDGWLCHVMHSLTGLLNHPLTGGLCLRPSAGPAVVTVTTLP